MAWRTDAHTALGGLDGSFLSLTGPEDDRSRRAPGHHGLEKPEGTSVVAST
jgi:hypothetical protein